MINSQPIVNGWPPGVQMSVTEVTVNAAYCQYYAYDGQAEFDAASVDMVSDGILAPARHGVRISTGVDHGPVRLSVHIVDEPLRLPGDDGDIVASACNLALPSGAILIADWSGERTAFRHDFGRPVDCALLVEVEGRDESLDHQYEPGWMPREQHRITVSPVPLVHGRWRTRRRDRADPHLATFTEHVGVAPASRPADPWFGTAGHPSVRRPGDSTVPRHLAERIAALPADAQRRLAVRAAMEICSYGADPLPWQAALTAVLEGRPLPPPYDNEQHARAMLPDHGPIGGAQVPAAEAALRAVLAAADPDPASAALEAAGHAASGQPTPALYFIGLGLYVDSLTA